MYTSIHVSQIGVQYPMSIFNMEIYPYADPHPTACTPLPTALSAAAPL